MKVTIISPFSFGYIDSLAEKFSAKSQFEVYFININDIPFKYSNLSERAKNFFLKLIFKRNLKMEYIENEILSRVNEKSQQDIIMVIRPDKFSREHLISLKSNTHKIITYLFDSVSSIPKQIENIDLFDEVYSYEVEDVSKYNFKFITNFIPIDYEEVAAGCGLFNISSYDERYPLILEVAKYLMDYSYPYKIVVRKEKPFTSKFVEIVKDYWNLEKVCDYILESEILLDIQKKGQHGLSFRVFEALGCGKKLITTNKSILQYDFYKPENILVIDNLNPIIPRSFLEQRTVEVPEFIKSKYRRENWINTVFS